MAFVNGRKLTIESCLAFSLLAVVPRVILFLHLLGTVVMEKTAQRIRKEELGVGEPAEH